MPESDALNFMRVNYPGQLSGNWYRVKKCPICNGEKGDFVWHSQTGNWKCQRTKESGGPFRLGYKSNENLQKEFSDIEKEIYKYRKSSGKQHRLNEKLLDIFPLKIHSVRFKSNSSKKLCFIKNGKPIKWLDTGKNNGWKGIPGIRGNHILNLENINLKKQNTIYILAGEWDLFTFYQNTGIYGITLSAGETNINYKNLDTSKWEFLQSKHVVILYDNDTAGRKGQNKLARAISCYIKTKSIKCLNWSKFSDIKAGHDIDDYFTDGGNPEKLFEEIEKCIPFESDKSNIEIIKPGSGLPAMSDDMNKRQLALYQADIFLNEWFNFRYNIILDLIEYKPKDSDKWKEFNDRIENFIYARHIASGGTISKTFFHDYINQEGIAPSYDHFKNYFNNLPDLDHNNITEIDKLMESMDIKGAESDFFKSIFPKWLILIYKQATLQDENRICLVFSGQQNKGKTSTFRKLCAPLMNGSRSYFFEGSLDPNRTDSIFTLSDNFLISLDELENTTKNSMAALKSLISRQVTTARRPYATRAETIRRRASFGGSVNDATDLLCDHTGNTRWMIFNSGNINFKLRDEIDYNKLWAEVKSLVKYNEHFQITNNDIKIQELNNLNYLQTGTEYDLINKYFNILEKDDVSDEFEGTLWYFFSATEIADQLQDKTRIKINPYNISRSISKLGGKSYVRWIQNKSIRGFYVSKKIYEN